MKLGIVGLPNVGKSTLFNALTKANVASENYPFCTIDPNVGTVPVPDERLDVLQKLYDAKKVVPAFVDFVDIAGLVRGASKGEGLGNKFLSHIREVDAIVHIVRCFDDPNIVHVDGQVNPERDIETIDTELILSDIETLQRRIEKAEKAIRATNDKKAKQDFEFMQRMLEHLSAGKTARIYPDMDEQKDLVKELFLLTSKPVVYVANIAEDELSKDISLNSYVNKIRTVAQKENSELIVISANIEAQIALLDDSEKLEFLQSLGLEESGLSKLIKASYHLLGLFSFLTAGKPEVRAWTISLGTKAPQAAGKIHTDFERGFIRAEIVNYHDLLKLGSLNAAKEAGKVRIEGKEYVMQQDDVVLFRFNL
jgi:ribosome-binding ATPase